MPMVEMRFAQESVDRTDAGADNLDPESPDPDCLRPKITTRFPNTDM